MEQNKAIITTVVIESYKNQLKNRNTIESLNKDFTKEKRDLFNEIIQIIDVFEKAEEIISERQWNNSDESDKCIKRLLTAKTRTLSILERHKVARIQFEDNISVDEFCKILDVEPDSNKPNGYIISIEKHGYLHEGVTLREAEVIVVRN
jgi:molecular chaperone GrpE (heat shock protein)